MRSEEDHFANRIREALAATTRIEPEDMPPLDKEVARLDREIAILEFLLAPGVIPVGVASLWAGILAVVHLVTGGPSWSVIGTAWAVCFVLALVSSLPILLARARETKK